MHGRVCGDWMPFYTIEEGHPLPRPAPPGHHKGGGTKGMKWRYPFGSMKVGDSFLVPDGDATVNRLRAAASQAARRLGFKFAVRQLDEGFRVWRTE